MLQNKETYTASTNGRSWAHIRHILVENNKNESGDMANNKPGYHVNDNTKSAASGQSRKKTVL